jgi:hypothetical protein
MERLLSAGRPGAEAQSPSPKINTRTKPSLFDKPCKAGRDAGFD